MTTTFKVDIPEDQIKEVLAEALLRTLDAKAREAVLAQAIAYLTTPHKGYSGDAVTPIQEAFNRTLQDYLTEIVKQIIEEDERVLIAVKQITVTAVEQWLESDKGPLIQQIVSYLDKAISERRW